MPRPRVALIDASHDDPHVPRNFRREVDANLVEFAAKDGDLPADTAFDGVIVTGSRSSAYDEEEWIVALCAVIESFVTADVPLIGICFGHQALAHALGGTVEAMDEYELGYREVTQVDSDPLFEDVPDPFLTFQTHSDTVTRLPEGATRVAENDRGLQAFRYGSAVGVQFHPEYDAETARDVTRRKDLPDERIEAVLSGITEDAVSRAAATKRLFDAFDDVVSGYRAQRQVADD